MSNQVPFGGDGNVLNIDPSLRFTAVSILRNTTTELYGHSGGFYDMYIVSQNWFLKCNDTTQFGQAFSQVKRGP